jgi:hypothetical protein
MDRTLLEPRKKDKYDTYGYSRFWIKLFARNFIAYAFCFGTYGQQDVSCVICHMSVSLESTCIDADGKPVLALAKFPNSLQILA